MKKKLTLKRKLAFLLAAIIAASTLGIFALADPSTDFWEYRGESTSRTLFAINNVNNPHLSVGTFCLAINIFGLGQRYLNLSVSAASTALGLSPQAIAEIRYAVALMHTMYIGSVFSQELAEARFYPETLNRQLGPRLTQHVIWYRQFMDNPTRYPSPAYRMSGGLTPREQSFFFNTGTGLPLGATVDLQLNELPTNPEAEELGLVGPFSLSWTTDSNAALINANGAPTFSIAQRELARMAIWENGEAVLVSSIGINQPFFIMPRASGQLEVTLRANSTVITSFEEFIFVGQGQPQYGITFTPWNGTVVSFESEMPNEVLIKQVMPLASYPNNDWNDEIELTPGMQALFRVMIETNDMGLDGIDVLFSPIDEAWRLAQNPIPIWTPEQFNMIRYNLSGHYVLMNNLCMVAFINAHMNGNWVPIGHEEDGSTHNFTGSLDGGGFTISGVNVHLDRSNVGLFAQIAPPSSGTHAPIIQNLVIRDFNMNGFTNVGGLVGNTPITSNHTIIENVQAYNVTVGGLTAVGGIIGRSAAPLNNLTASNITISNRSTGSVPSGIPGNAGGFGGIAGTAMERLISNVHVENITVHFPRSCAGRPWGWTSAIGGVVGIGGVIHNASAVNVNFSNSIFNFGSNTTQGGVGGIAGAARDIRDVSVSQMIYHNSLNSGASSGGVGGIVGTLRPMAGSTMHLLNAMVLDVSMFIGNHTYLGTLPPQSIDWGGAVGRIGGEAIIAEIAVYDFDVNIMESSARFSAKRIGGIVGNGSAFALSNVFASGHIEVRIYTIEGTSENGVH